MRLLWRTHKTTTSNMASYNYSQKTIDAIAKLNNTSPDIVDKQLCIGAEMTNEFFKNKEINNIDDLVNCDVNSLLLTMRLRMRMTEEAEKRNKKSKKVKKGKKGRKIKINVIKRKN